MHRYTPAKPQSSARARALRPVHNLRDSHRKIRWRGFPPQRYMTKIPFRWEAPKQATVELPRIALRKPIS
jgi:hypothetical protein